MPVYFFFLFFKIFFFFYNCFQKNLFKISLSASMKKKKKRFFFTNFNNKRFNLSETEKKKITFFGYFN